MVKNIGYTKEEGVSYERIGSSVISIQMEVSSGHPP